MINPKSRHGYFTALCMIAPQMMYAKSKVQESIDKLLKRSTHEQVIQKEYPLTGKKTIYLENIDGDIIVNAWNNPTLLVTATKQAPKAEYLSLRSMDDSESNKTGITIKTRSNKDKKAEKVSIRYELVVPPNTRLELVSESGNIIIKEVNGHIVAKTCKNGNIEINNAQSSIHAQVERNGSIVINRADHNVKAFAHHGDITIHNAQKGVIAQADKGKLDIECLKVPTTGKLSLNTRSGNITLRIPESTSAELQAHTEKGTLTCAHYVTVKPMTTQLNSNAWTRFRREVEGTLGTGEASINVHTHNGNIKILDVTA